MCYIISLRLFTLMVVLALTVAFALRPVSLTHFARRSYRLPTLYAEISDAEQDLTLSLSTRAWDILDTANVALKEQRSLLLWEKKLDDTLSELRALKSSDVLMAVYLSILKRAASSMLSPLQITSFDKLASGVIDSMNRVLPPGATASTLTDVFTDKHFECIESFRSGIGRSSSFASSTQASSKQEEDVESDEIFPQSEAEENLVYQFGKRSSHEHIILPTTCKIML